MSDSPSQHPYQSAPAGPSLLPGGPNRPSPIGLGLSGAGLLLLAIGSLIPQMSLSGPDEALAWLAASGFHNTGLPGLAPALILLVLVVWTAAGVSPAFQWVAKLGGVGLAALTTAAALHPVLEANSALDSVEMASEVSVSAGGGIWLYLLASILLAISIFMMRWSPQPAPVQPPPGQPAPTGQFPAQPPQPPTAQQPTTPTGWPQPPNQQQS